MSYNLKFILVLILSKLCFLVSFAQPNYDYSRLKREKLGRGLVAIREDSTTVGVSWRYLSSDPMDVWFDIYRNGKKINKEAVSKSTYFKDVHVPNDNLEYELVPRVKGKKKAKSEPTKYFLKKDSPHGYINIPLNVPEGGVTPDGQRYFYSPNDGTVADVDGDGEYEIILKWDPSNARDNSHNGYTGNVYIDCYKLNGEQLWRIDLGKNIRAGAHYTQMIAYDLDGDGKAEVVFRTSDGTVDGAGNVIGDKDADYRNENGRILTGNEYLTLFDGLTGKALSTVDYIPERGNPADWGDDRANRSDRFLACVAYLDGEYPSVVMCRGYYTRTVLAAFDWRNGKLTNRWVFDSDTPGNEAYAGQGNHNLRVADVDGDGCDEIIYGSCTINNDGTGLYSTEMEHGDAIHLTAFDPSSSKLQVWDCHENGRDGSTFRDAETGNVIFQVRSRMDVGRCMAADIDPTNKGVEMWSLDSKGIRNIKGEVINNRTRRLPVNMATWWDGDLTRELLDGTRIFKYNHISGNSDVIFDCRECMKNNGTKSTPVLSADILGDWREELILKTRDNKNLRIFVTPHETDYRFHTFMEDPIYRISVATQNIGYNQPTQTGFYFGSDIGKCFPEKELVVQGSSAILDAGMDYDSFHWSIGGSERTREVSVKEFSVNRRTKVELIVTFRGQEFKDYVYITFKP